MTEAVYIYRIMVKPSVKATEVLEKAPAAKTLRNRWISGENPKLGVSVRD